MRYTVIDLKDLYCISAQIVKELRRLYYNNKKEKKKKRFVTDSKRDCTPEWFERQPYPYVCRPCLLLLLIMSW